VDKISLERDELLKLLRGQKEEVVTNRTTKAKKTVAGLDSDEILGLIMEKDHEIKKLKGM